MPITDDELPFDECIDAKDCLVSPGFVDIHNHGGTGFEYGDATKEAIVKTSNIHARHGATTIFPSFATHSLNEMTEALDALNKFKDDKEIIANIAGVHLEGQYFSPDQCGGQEADQLREPDPKEYMHMIEHYKKTHQKMELCP